MIVFMAMLLTIVAFACATYPLLRKRDVAPAYSTGDEDLEELQSRRDTTYSMLKELEFDYQSGILSKDDYDELRGRYKRKAVAILKDMDGTPQQGSVNEEIEQRIQTLRRRASTLLPDKGGGDKTADEIEKRVLTLRRGEGSQSPDKGGGDKAVDEIEKRVLTSRQQQGQFCRRCGVRHEPGDRFCAHCGARLFKEGKR